MAQEIETKVLDVDTQILRERLNRLGAVKVLEVRMIVDWFRPIGTREGEDAWFLRIRSRSDGISEVTWKSRSEQLGVARAHEELQLTIQDPEQMAQLFERIGLEHYAHQEKDRCSWTYQDWRLDLDKYPGVPAYLEIEGTSDAHIQKAMTLLELSHHPTSAEGERVVIQKIYHQNWYDLRFPHN